MHWAGVARWRLDCQELHSAFRAVPWFLTHDVWVHWAAVDDGPVAFRRAHVHFGEEAKRLVRLGVEVGRDSLSLGRHVLVRSEHGELLGQRWLGSLFANPD